MIVQCPAAQQSVFLIFRHSQYGVATDSASANKKIGWSKPHHPSNTHHVLHIYILDDNNLPQKQRRNVFASK